MITLGEIVPKLFNFQQLIWEWFKHRNMLEWNKMELFMKLNVHWLLAGILPKGVEYVHFVCRNDCSV